MAGSIRPKFKKVLRSTTNQRPLLLYRSIKNLSISNKSSMKIVNLFSPTCLAKKKLKSKNFLMIKILIRIFIKSNHFNSFNLGNISRWLSDFKLKNSLLRRLEKSQMPVWCFHINAFLFVQLILVFHPKNNCIFSNLSPDFTVKKSNLLDR